MIRALRNILFLVLALSLSTVFSFENGVSARGRAAASHDEHDDALAAIKRGEIMSFSQIKRVVESRLGGRVVDLKLRRTNQGWQYFLRVSRKDGRVVAAVVDAKTARILSTS